MMDLLMQVVWTLLAVSSVCLVVRHRAGAPGAWWVVMVVCCLFAADKAIDLQVPFYQFMQWCLHTAEAWFGAVDDHRFVRSALLVVGTVLVVVAIWAAVHRDRDFDRGKQIATVGLLLVVLPALPITSLPPVWSSSA